MSETTLREADEEKSHENPFPASVILVDPLDDGLETLEVDQVQHVADVHQPEQSEEGRVVIASHELVREGTH